MSNKQENNFPKIGAPALRALHVAGYTKLEQFTNVGEEELLKIHGVGPKAIRLLREVMEAEGLSFASTEHLIRGRKPKD